MTFVELLLALMILGIITAMVTSSLGLAKKKAMRSRCMSNLKLIGVSLRSFSEDNDARFPWLMTQRDAAALWQLIYGGEHTGYHHCWDVRFIFLPPSIRFQLGTAEPLASPCDPHVIAQKAHENNIGIFDKFGGRFDGEHFHMSRKALSYAVHLGSDPQLTSTILATTRNIVGTPGYEFEYPATKTAPAWNDYLGCSLRAADDFGEKQIYLGATHQNFEERQWHAMGSLEPSQGQMLFSDGSARLMGNLRLKEAIYDHSKQTGGLTEKPNENLSRPTQREADGDYFVK